MARPTSTLLISPASQLDFAARLAFFALAPLGIVAWTAVFPVLGALINVVVALAVFIAGEAVQGWARRSRVVRWLLNRELALEAYYRQTPPRPFAYYVFYPLLFPYWLTNREARREFWLYKGYTLGSIVILLASVIYQYLRYWRPELGLKAYAPVVLSTLGVETLLVLGLLMPIATTVVHLHQTFRRRRLLALLLVAMASTGLGVAHLVAHRDPIVSYSTRQRVRLRTAAAPQRAREAQRAALREAWITADEDRRAVEGDGKIEGKPLDRAHEALRRFYKDDEAVSFDLWASPRTRPNLVVLYFEARPGHPPIWLAMRRGGEEVKDAKQLPKGAFIAMKHAAEE